MAVPDGQGGLRSLSAVAYLTANGGGFTINSTLPTPPLACLFAKVDFQGDVQCFKPGTGQLSARMTNKTNSMRLFGGAFAKGYAGQEQAFHYENDTTEVAQLPGPFNTLMVSPCPPGTVLQADLQQ
ncbi:MAG: hypothetical protein M1838_000601 [Thelocarpon superellum]|nr:MAG: hypothetical protein M1838_000601 [Thelocarpon superellum]